MHLAIHCTRSEKESFLYLAMEGNDLLHDMHIEKLQPKALEGDFVM